jgi:hypothetical protein
MARRIESIEEFRALSERDRDERSAVLSAIALARHEGIPLAAAASARGTTLDAIFEWAPEAVRRGFLGIPLVTEQDSIWRLRMLYVDGQLDYVGVQGSEEADTADLIRELQWAWIHGDREAGDALQAYRGTVISGRQVETDLDALRQIAARGDDPVEVYKELLG